ncbi:MAG: hypothetical protein M3463_13380, partial [Verrucomicrobiota bacterium]|nr:hypothetical protein [Verrucomicrobiota bacterium]
EAEARAVAFLQREVPAWSRENGCFSCHHNGDAARALYAAARKGYRIPADVLADTTAWVARPGRWDENKGDPAFSDKRLTNVQFAASLIAAFEAGYVSDRQPIQEAARKVAADQAAAGSWPIEPGNAVGSPATYGTALATYMACRTLQTAGVPETNEAIRKAQGWLRKTQPNNVPTAAALLLASARDPAAEAESRKKECLNVIRKAQTGDGGWGPYVDAPPEPFDTALVLLALAGLRDPPAAGEMIKRGRFFLAARQGADGSWPATTRPPGGDSYAQRVSTTAWAAIALLATRE